MPHDLPARATCLVSSGTTNDATTATSDEFHRLLALVRAATDAQIDLVQLREKLLRPRVLYELAARASEITHGTPTRLLVNDRADIARSSGADGVHLTACSLEARVVRRAFGEDFLIGVSAHTLEEARAARDGGANFALFGPVFDTPSKRAYGSPVGLERLTEVARTLAPFPVLAIGGVTGENARETIAAGARGVAAIRLFGDPATLGEVIGEIKRGSSV
jgi:thiamine-phosphate pyrophosphorylase